MSFYRGASPSSWDDSARTAIDALTRVIDAPLALEVWETALSCTWTGDPVWFHGDLSAGNLLVQDGQLSSARMQFGWRTGAFQALQEVMAERRLAMAG